MPTPHPPIPSTPVPFPHGGFPMRRIVIAVAMSLIATQADAGPFRRPAARPTTTCVGGACRAAVVVTTAPVRVVRRVVGR